MSILDGLLSAAGDFVGAVSVRTNLNADDPLVFDPEYGGGPPPRAPGPPAPIPGPRVPGPAPAPAPPPSDPWLLRVLQPEVTVELPTGEAVYAPYGTPSANHGPWVAAGFAAVALGVVGLAGRMVHSVLGTWGSVAVASGGVLALGVVAADAEARSTP